jgi:hypothetical protein
MQSACLDCKNPELIFEEVLDPFPELFDFRARQRADRLLDLLNIAAHVTTMAVAAACSMAEATELPETRALPNRVWERGA